jgi:hypothetical protein
VEGPSNHVLTNDTAGSFQILTSIHIGRIRETNPYIPNLTTSFILNMSIMNGINVIIAIPRHMKPAITFLENNKIIKNNKITKAAVIIIFSTEKNLLANTYH